MNVSTEVPVASPCIGLCRVNGDDICLGCGRSIDEITQWSRATEPRRQAIVEVAARRRAILGLGNKGGDA